MQSYTEDIEQTVDTKGDSSGLVESALGRLATGRSAVRILEITNIKKNALNQRYGVYTSDMRQVQMCRG